MESSQEIVYGEFNPIEPRELSQTSGALDIRICSPQGVLQLENDFKEQVRWFVPQYLGVPEVDIADLCDTVEFLHLCEFENCDNILIAYVHEDGLMEAIIEYNFNLRRVNARFSDSKLDDARDRIRNAYFGYS